MIPDSLTSCSYLLLGCGGCINRLVNHSYDKFSKVLPQFVIASIGIGAIGARSFHVLLYNMFWRSYPLDPRSIAKELQKVQHDKNFVDWILSRGGMATLIYSFYYHYEFSSTGMFFVVSLTTVEALLLLIKDIAVTRQIQAFWRRVSMIFRKEPYPLATFWILSNEFFGRAVGNHYCRLANVPYAITIWAFPPEGFYQGWSIMNSINDYMMLCYIILMTEGLCM